MKQSVLVLSIFSACLFGIRGLMIVANLKVSFASRIAEQLGAGPENAFLQFRRVSLLVASGFTVVWTLAILSVCIASIGAIPLERSKLPAFIALALSLVSVVAHFGLLGIDFIGTFTESGDEPFGLRKELLPTKLRILTYFVNGLLVAMATTLLCWPIIRHGQRGATRAMGIVTLVSWLLAFALGATFWSVFFLTDSVPSTLRYSLTARAVLNSLAGICLCTGVMMLAGQARQEAIVTAQVVAPKP